MMRPFFKQAWLVVGVDTEIGKTLVTCTLAHHFVQSGYRTVAMKPVASGAFFKKGIWQNEDVIRLQSTSNVTLPAQHQKLVNPYLFKEAIAPHIAAAHENTRIELNVILHAFDQLKQYAEMIIVEGVGGFRVPLNDEIDTADMAVALGLPIVLVVGMRLGAINQACLTAEAILTRGLTLAGWVANSITPAMPFLAENIAAIQKRIAAPFLGHIPYLHHPTPEEALGYLHLHHLLH